MVRWSVAIAVFGAGVPWVVQSAENQTFTALVCDVAGFPIPGAQGRLLSLDRVWEAKARADGELQFDGAAPGTYRLEVSARGFRQRIYPDVRVPAGDSQPMRVALSPENQCGDANQVDYEAVGAAGRRLSGYVLDEDSGKGVSGVTLELINPVSDTQMSVTVSDSNGDFTFRDLEAGRYRVRASKKSYQPSVVSEFLVPKENVTVLHLRLDKRGHMHVCQ